MLRLTSGNILESEAQVLVNPVNTVGVMGKGLALGFKEKFPKNFLAYVDACRVGDVVVGKMFVFQLPQGDGMKDGSPRYIVNFPTKSHWRNPSKMEWIEDGLEDLRKFLIAEKIKSIAIPPIGAGLGGLDWPQVKKRIIDALQDLDLEVLVFEPLAPTYNKYAKTVPSIK